MAGIADRITAAEQRAQEAQKKLQQLKAERDRIEARKLAKVIKGQSGNDTRRKILVGAAVLARVERGEWSEAKLLAMLDTYLTRADDRTLFGLPALQEPASLPQTGEI